MPLPSSAPLPSLWVIVPAAGCGSRFTQSIPPQTEADFRTVPNKLLLPLPTGRLVLQEVIYRLGAIPCVAGIVVLTSEENQATVAQLLNTPKNPLVPPDKRLLLTLGGNTRRASVLAGLEAVQLADSNATFVAVHDAARPNLDPFWLQEALLQLQQLMPHGTVGICAGTKIQDTVKACQPLLPATQDVLGNQPPLAFLPIMTHTVDRTLLWQVQTPQLFVFSVLLQAHWAVSPQFEATDDAQLVELAKLGSVVIKPTSPWNLKLTTWQDYQLLQTVV